jgi:hypothetical protein
VAALTSNDISVFELLSSGAVQRLAEHLTGRDLAAGAEEGGGGGGGEARDAALLRRLGAFVELLLAPGTASSPPLLALMRKLLSALASVEAFPVVRGCLAVVLGRPPAACCGCGGGAAGAGNGGARGAGRGPRARALPHCTHPRR